MEEQLPYRAEYAKTGRAKCKGCKSGIGAGELRVAAMVQSPFHDGKQANWYHCDCFFVKQRPKSITDIAYFFSLKYDDQQILKARIESNVVVPSMTDSSSKGKKRAKPCDALKDFGIEYSKSSRADCRACQQKIIKGEIRIKKVSFETEAGMKFGGQALWHHVECFEKVRDELLYFESGDKLPGFASLKKDDKEMIKNTIQEKTEVPEVKKIKMEVKDPEQIAKDLELEAKMKKQNDQFYKYKTELEELSKIDLHDLITTNKQIIPDGTTAIKALDLAADLLTFGSPGKCTACNNGVFTLGNNTYVCNGSLDEWAKCSNKTQDPPRIKTIIPEWKGNYQFLKSYKSKITKRLFHPISVVDTSVIKNETVDETDKPKIQREKPKLYKMTFLVVGKTQINLGELNKIITQFGGEVKTKLTDKITAVISNQQEIQKMNNRMTNVEHLKLPVISDDFFSQLNKDSDTIKLMQQFNISPWTDVLSTIPQKLEEKEEENKKSHKSLFTKSSTSSKVTMKIKGGGAVDPDSKLDSVAHVYEKDGVKYNSILSLADLQTGQNSFYKMQILQSDINLNQFWLFRSWGRIGTTVGGNKVESVTNAYWWAISKFKDLYFEKTKNYFGAETFQKYPGFYNPIDVEFEEIQNKFSKDCKIPSKLDEPIQNLIKLMFDIDLMKQTMIQFEIDTEKMPLGKLSKSQIEKALLALNDITLLIERGAKENEFISPTNRFYTLIPHNFGMKAPTLLNETEIIKQKIEMLESLMEIELAYSMLNDTKITDDVNPIDAHYGQLKTNMEVLDPDSDEFKTLQLYVKNTHASTHNMYDLEIQNVYKICREDEADRFQKYKKLHNHKLLWHGSRLTNFVGILSNGLRIAPPEAPCTGYMFGKGIYFADMVSKSANYCFTSPANNTGLLLLCDVALGNMQEYTSSHYVTNLPKGKHSTKGVGNTQPDPKGSIIQDGLEIPCGQPLKDFSNSNLLYNEYIIYDIEQVNVKYLLNLKFNYPNFY